MNTKKQEEIDQYLFNKLSATEKTDFDQKMADNKNIKEDFLLQKRVVQNIQSYGNELLKGRLQTIHQEMITKQKKSPILLYALGIACSMVLIIFTFLYFNNSSQIATFHDYYEPYSLSFQTRSTNQLRYENDFKIQILYQNQQYAEALSLLEKLSIKNPKNPKFLLGKGICYIELEEWEKALATFNAIIQLNDPFFKDHAIWYAALVHYKLQNFHQAKNNLKILVGNAHADHYEDAQQLLNILENK